MIVANTSLTAATEWINFFMVMYLFRSNVLGITQLISDED
jgi:hypothetical protein